MSKNQKTIASKVALAMGDVVGDVAAPTRTRSSSFTSMLVDLRVGDNPVSRVLPVDVVVNENTNVHRDCLNEAKDRMRNNVQSSINHAKRRDTTGTAAYSVECKEQLFDSGIFVVALVRRVA